MLRLWVTVLVTVFYPAVRMLALVGIVLAEHQRVAVVLVRVADDIVPQHPRFGNVDFQLGACGFVGETVLDEAVGSGCASVAGLPCLVRACWVWCVCEMLIRVTTSLQPMPDCFIVPLMSSNVV